jgi:hypothetical protein
MRVPQSHTTSSSSSSDDNNVTVKRALCLAENDMVSLVNETVELLGLRLDHVITIHEAVMALRCCRYEVMITAVSTSQANLFDESSFDERTCQMVYKSQLLQQAICESPWTYRIVYGYEAMEFEDVRYACFDCGADAVVNSSDALFTSLFGFLTAASNDQQQQEQLYHGSLSSSSSASY